MTDLYILGGVNKKAIRADKWIEIEYKRLRALQNFDDSSANIICKSSSSNIVITLLNITSLKRHYFDVMYDNKIVESDVMAFTETRLKPLQNTNAIEDPLKEFQIIFQNQNNDFFSLAICGNTCHGVLASGKKFF